MEVVDVISGLREMGEVDRMKIWLKNGRKSNTVQRKQKRQRKTKLEHKTKETEEDNKKKKYRI